MDHFLNGQRASYTVGQLDSDFRTMDDVASTWPVLGGEQNPTATTKQVAATAKSPSEAVARQEDPVAGRPTEPPAFFRLFNRTYRIETDSAGERTGYDLNLRSGRIELDTSQLNVWYAENHYESRELDGEVRYIELTEAVRASHLSGDGPIFALYDTVRTL